MAAAMNGPRRVRQMLQPGAQRATPYMSES